MAWHPIERAVTQYMDGNGDPYSDAVLKFYAAGTSTNISIATDSTGGTTATDVPLNGNGNPEISGNVIIPHVDQDFKIALYPTQAAADADSGADWTIDNVSIASATESEWTDSGITPTFVDATSFTFSGDQTSIFHVGRRIRITDSGGIDYATITAAAYTTLTTITVGVDGGGSIDSGLSAVSYSILAADSRSTPEPFVQGADIASAAALPVDIPGTLHDVTGTITITSFDAVRIGTIKVLQFDDALTLTHHATNLILPGAANITTVAGDIGTFYEYASGDWRCLSYKGSATQAEMEAVTDTAKPVTPGRQHFHPGHPKGWALVNMSATEVAGYNVTSIADNGTGEFTVTWSVTFSANPHFPLATIHTTNVSNVARLAQVRETSTTATHIQCILVSDTVAPAATETSISYISIAVYGDI